MWLARDPTRKLEPASPMGLWGCTPIRRMFDRRRAACLVDDGELAVQVVAQKPEEAFSFVEFDPEAFGFLAGGRGEARRGDDDPLGELPL